MQKEIKEKVMLNLYNYNSIVNYLLKYDCEEFQNHLSITIMFQVIIITNKVYND